MPVRSAEATWEGALKDGDGEMALGSGAWTGAYSFASRFEDGDASNPEELIGAAHAGCYSMALSNELDGAGFTPEWVHTVADVHLDQVDGDFAITKVVLTCEAIVPDATDEEFLEIAEAAKEGCPVSKALGAIDIELDAQLVEE